MRYTTKKFFLKMMICLAISMLSISTCLSVVANAYNASYAEKLKDDLTTTGKAVVKYYDEVKAETWSYAKKGTSDHKKYHFNPARHNFHVYVEESKGETWGRLFVGFPLKKSEDWASIDRMIVNYDGTVRFIDLSSYKKYSHEERNTIFNYFDIPLMDVLDVISNASTAKKVLVRYEDRENEEYADYELTKEQLEGLQDILKYQALCDTNAFLKRWAKHTDGDDDFFEESEWNETDLVKDLSDTVSARFRKGKLYDGKWKEAKPINFTSVFDAYCTVKTYYAPYQVIQYVESIFEGQESTFMLCYKSKNFYFESDHGIIQPGVTISEAVEFFDELPSDFDPDENEIWYSYGVGVEVNLNFENHRLSDIYIHSGANEEFPDEVYSIFEYKWRE